MYPPTSIPGWLSFPELEHPQYSQLPSMLASQTGRVWAAKSLRRSSLEKLAGTQELSTVDADELSHVKDNLP